MPQSPLADRLVHELAGWIEAMLTDDSDGLARSLLGGPYTLGSLHGDVEGLFTAKSACGSEMRLQGEEPVEAVGTQGPQRVADLAVSFAGRNDLAAGEKRVLDLDVLQMRAQDRIA